MNHEIKKAREHYDTLPRLIKERTTAKHLLAVIQIAERLLETIEANQIEQRNRIIDSASKPEEKSEELPNDIWKDPNVKAALKEGRPPTDIMVISCPKCSRYGYYNQGSSFWCRFCKEGWHCLSEGEEAEGGASQYLHLEDDPPITLDDTVTDVTDGYHNQTRNPE